YKGNEGVAGYVQRTPGALGYTELTYALQQNLRYGAVKNKAGAYVLADLQSVTTAAEAVRESIPEDLRYSLTDAPAKGSYPITGSIWAVLYIDQPADRGKKLVDFLTWVTHDGQQACEALHYARLPQALVGRLVKRLALVKTGK